MAKFTTNTINSDSFRKLKSLTHYICCLCDPEDLGAVKLNKVLWYSELQWYIEHGKQITGEKYIKQQRGPMSMNFYNVISALQDEGSIHTRGVEYYGFPKTEYIPFKKADISEFTAEQISLVDRIAEYVCKNHTARSISLKSHDFIWNIAEIGEEIPFYAAFGSMLGDITGKDIERAQKKLGIPLEKVA